MPNLAIFSPPSGTPFEFDMRVTTACGSVERVVLLRPGILTHHFDNDQRYIELDFEYKDYPGLPPSVPGTYTLQVEAPTKDLGPPGHYMLFVVTRNSGGDLLPSIGEFIQLDV
jgi:hypothetical protein